LRLDPQLIGQTVRCPACRKTFVVSTVSFAEFSGPGRASSGKGSGTKTTAGTPPGVPEAELSLEAYGTRMISGDSAETFAGKKSGSGELSTATGKVGRFEVHEVLGRGAFGVVSRAYDPLLDRQVALKVPLFSSKEGKRAQRFLNEAKAAARLRHPNIVAVYEGGEADGKLYLAAEYIKGQTLAEVIKNARPKLVEGGQDAVSDNVHAAEDNGSGRMPDLLSIEQSVRWVRELAGALAYAHAQGVVHRDMKPHNIMIDAEGRPQIMDFGLAKRIDQDAKMTSEGALLGTPAYMPPEQARGDIERVGPHSDQYSLGAVLYELLTGRRPFDGPPAVVIAKAVAEEPPAPRTIIAGIPEDLEAICLKAMERDPARRYVNCIALAADLANWEQGEGTAARPLTSVERAKRWARRSPAIAGLVATVAALLVLAAGGSAVAAFVFSQSNREHAAALAAARERTDKAAAQAQKAAIAVSIAEEGTRQAKAEIQRAEEARKEHEQVIASFDEATRNRVLKEEELKGIREERKKTGRSAAGAGSEARIPAIKEIAGAKTDDKSNARTGATYEGSRAAASRDDNRLHLKFIWCPPGEFTMGSPESEIGRGTNENQVHATPTIGFWIGKFETTWYQFNHMQFGSTGAAVSAKFREHPATVSWDRAMRFCRSYTDEERRVGRLPKDWEYTLPTEAQWEYACRAGTTSAYSFGDDASQLSQYACCRASATQAEKIGLRKPNPWGLRDMHGNVSEWCRDAYSDKIAAGVDPTSSATDVKRVVRGGAWNSDAADCRSASRTSAAPEDKSNTIGFRVVVSRVR
jgi:formylglycine-generating enzyme required for sulfatase activity/tRNA A-37 threonylcarbamoyl transferase component Bud32